MKNKIIVMYCMFFITISISSQDLSVTVLYKQATKNKRITKTDEIKVYKGLEYTLIANRGASEFKIQEVGLKENPQNGRFAFRSLFYKNIIAKEKLSAIKFTNEDYIIKNKFNEYDWTLTKENKIIGGYTCYKAIATTVVEDMLGMGKSRTYDVVAWYSPSIPLPFGPRGFDGLPGLVLEVYWDTNFLIAKNISIKKDATVTITRPTAEIEMTEEQFTNKVRKRYEYLKRKKN